MNKRIADMTSEERADAVSRGVLEVKACKYCGEEFYALCSSTAKFCGDRCRRMYWHEQKKAALRGVRCADTLRQASVLQ